MRDSIKDNTPPLCKGAAGFAPKFVFRASANRLWSAAGSALPAETSPIGATSKACGATEDPTTLLPGAAHRHLVRVAPAPVLAGLEGGDDRVAAAVVVLGGRVLRKAWLSWSSMTDLRMDLLIQELGGAPSARERVEPDAGIKLREPR